jgi:hypothetical protein
MGINKIKYLGRKFFGVLNLNLSSYDPDALAYFNVNAAITSAADKNAINSFYLGLKSDGIYTKIYWMILPIWGTALNSKWNLINNRTYDMTFSSGWTYASNGITPLNAYADNFLIPLTTLSQNNSHLSFYSGTNEVAANKFEIGSSGNPGSGTNSIAIGVRFSGNLFLSRVNALTDTSVANTNSLGFYIGSRLIATTQQIFKNGTKTSSSVNSTGLSPNSINVGRWNNPTGTSYYTTKQCRFASCGEGFTDTDATNFTNRVNTLLTYFGINTF